MPISRRGFLWRSLGVSIAATTVPSAAWGISARSGSPTDNNRRILLDQNENPYGTSPKIFEAMRSALELSNRYPYLATDNLAEEIARHHGVNTNQVLVGCGSTEILRSCAQAFLAPGQRLVIADPSYEAVSDYATQIGAEVSRVRLNHRHQHDLHAMRALVVKSATLIYICNPNNPTGTLTPRADLEAFIAQLPSQTYVLIDEAYHHYAGISQDYVSFIDRPVSNPRVIVTRTFSKVYGLAGMRVGYAVAAAPTLSRIARHQLWSDVSIVSLRAASAALRDAAFLQLSVQRNANDRQEFFNQAQSRGLKPLDSHTNFYLVPFNRPAKEVIAHFKRHDILIGREFPSMNSYIRVSLGLPSEMREFWRVWDLMPTGKTSM